MWNKFPHAHCDVIATANQSIWSMNDQKRDHLFISLTVGINKITMTLGIIF